MVTKEQVEKHTKFRWKGTNQGEPFTATKYDGEIREGSFNWWFIYMVEEGENKPRWTINQSNCVNWEVIE